MAKKKGTKNTADKNPTHKKKLVVKNTGITGITEIDSDSECLIKRDNKMFGGNRSDQDNDNESDVEELEEEIEEIEEVDDIDIEDDLEQDQEDAEIDNEDDEDDGKEDGQEETGDGDADDENCLYKYAAELSDDEAELDEIYDDGDTYTINSKLVKPEDRTTNPRLFSYEKVRLISDRSKQLASNAKPMLKGLDRLSEKEQALAEFKEGVIPIFIERTLPDNRIEHWKLDELEY